MATKRTPRQISIFISHSSRDQVLAEALVNLLRSALGISAEGIRCTSVPGHLLPPGLSIEDRLRTEVRECKVLLALITPYSLSSSYFLFELGARWITDLSLYPLFASGVSPNDVNDWLRAKNGIRCESETDLHGLITSLASEIKCHANAPSYYLLPMKKFITASEEAHRAYIEEYGSQLDPKTQLSDQARMKAADAELGSVIADFWNIANKYYINVFRPKRTSDFPDTLEGLIHAAGAPPNTTDGNPLITWPERTVHHLKQDQRRLWNFAGEVYPIRPPDATGDIWIYSNIRPEEDAKRFHDARRELAKHFDYWPPLVGYKFILERFGSRRGIVLLLPWLELALVRSMRQEGRGKQDLFKLANRFEKIGTSA
jgi:hypothetical protein